MKTPRELLFARHRSVTPKLDDIRQRVVDQLAGGEPETSLAKILWRELFLPAHRVWLGVGAAWVVILVLNLTSGSEAAGNTGAPGPMAADSIYHLQKVELGRLAEIATPSTVKPAAPGPRSEARIEQKIA